MSQDSKLKVAELDFDAIKTNLKNFLKSQTEFTDYNFDGSGMSVLLDLLAYNTHYMGYYMNMIANEMFIDTAQTRRSVVSHAKLLGYTPRSRVCSKAIVNVVFANTSPYNSGTTTLPRFSRFASTSKDSASYVFVNTETTTVTRSANGNFIMQNLELKEGQPQGYSFEFNVQSNPKQIFELPDYGIDINTLRVQVQVSSQKTTRETYVRAEDATEVNSSSLVYYIEENRNGKYQIYFGNNIIGKGLDDGNIVNVTYLVSSGTEANGIRSFRLMDEIIGLSSTTTLVSESSAGAIEESLENIKFVAPKSFISQNRAVTKNDYISLINRKYPYFSAVTVWGGEENNPPVFGKVFFSAKPLGNYQITVAEIEHIIENVIKPFSIVTITPEYVAPDYIFLNLDVNVVYNPTKTNRTEGQVKSVVRSAIINYANQNLNNFNITYKNSKIVKEIDNADKAIENNEIQLTLEKRFRPTRNQPRDYILDFGVPLIQGTSTRKVFGVTGFKYFDTTGVLRDAFLEEVPQSYTGISDVVITNSGINYSEDPVLTVIGDGTGAVITPVIINGKISRVNIVNPGVDYTSAAITVTGGNGTGAILTPLLDAKTGRLRIYYYDSNRVKKVINENAGIVYYNEGYVKLEAFNPNLIVDALGTMVVKAYPNTSVFTVSKNKLLALDATDPDSINIKVSAIEI